MHALHGYRCRSPVRAAGCERQADAGDPAAGLAALPPEGGHVPRDFEIVINHFQEDPKLVRAFISRLVYSQPLSRAPACLLHACSEPSRQHH